MEVDEGKAEAEEVDEGKAEEEVEEFVSTFYYTQDKIILKKIHMRCQVILSARTNTVSSGPGRGVGKGGGDGEKGARRREYWEKR